jgi:pimeloyl-ACP methyl ester carboxylesterase
MESHQFISFKNSTIFYKVLGAGKTVVFVHGFGEDGTIWDEMVKRLKNDFQIIIPDLPGSGKSTILKNGDKQVSIDDYAEAIIEVLKNEAISKCTLIGHSMGGYVVLAMVERNPEILRSFGFCHSSAFADNEEKKQIRRKSIEFIQAHDAMIFLRTSIPGLFGDKFKLEHGNIVEQLITHTSYFSNETLIQYQAAMINRPDRTHVLQNSKLPVLFIMGEKDQSVPIEQSLAQCHLPSISFVHILPDAGHMGMIEEPERCANAMVSFLNNS